MERKLATIQIINSLTPIKGADRIETAHVLGWEVVVRKGEFKVGDKVVYIEVDSILPEIPVFEFMRERKFRVRTIKLKKQISQGLIFALFDLGLASSYPVGKDVTALLNITKYDPQQLEEEELLTQKEIFYRGRIEKFLYKYKWYRNIFLKIKKKNTFPSFITKTDEERIQNIPNILSKIKNHEILVDITEKIDGQSATYFLYKQNVKTWYGKTKIVPVFGVCSRNLQLFTPNNSNYWQMAKKYNIEKVLKKIIGSNDLVVLQVEIYGEGIQKNKYQLAEKKIAAFNLIIDHIKCSYTNMRELLNINSDNIECVPRIYFAYNMPETVEEVVKLAKGNSIINPTIKREGIVVRNTINNISFKAINPEFLLKFEET